jgi:enoyl-CoA hydratase
MLSPLFGKCIKHMMSSRLLSSSPSSLKSVLTWTEERVAVMQLNRPKVYNALSSELMNELGHTADKYDKDPSIGAMVITGNEKAFAAGADIKEMKDKTFIETYQSNFLESWAMIARLRKPVLAAVNGFALGGGCELAMMCDIIYAGENARFGQPEIQLGTTPGAGGSQRLSRAIGKSKAMEWILTGRHYTAEEAERAGLVARVFSTDKTLEETIKIAKLIASYSQPIVAMCKEAILRSYETSLADGLIFEKRLFYSTFATKDQKEGMSAFSEKRNPQFEHC